MASHLSHRLTCVLRFIFRSFPYQWNSRDVPLPLHEKKSSSSNNLTHHAGRKRRLEKDHDEGDDAKKRNDYASSTLPLLLNADDERTIDIDKASLHDDDDVGPRNDRCRHPAPLAPVTTTRSNDEGKTATTATTPSIEKEEQPHHDDVADHHPSVSPRSGGFPDYALPSTSSPSPPPPISTTTSPPPPLPHDDSSAGKWEAPCGVNPDVLRTLQIEYWDRTRACKEKKWDHMVSLRPFFVAPVDDWWSV